jgi:hypothetical protein
LASHDNVASLGTECIAEQAIRSYDGCVDPLATQTSLAGIVPAAQQQAPAVPRNPAEARQMSAAFLMQLESSMAMLGSGDEAGGEGEEDGLGGGSDGFGGMFDGLGSTFATSGLAGLLPGLSAGNGAAGGTNLLGQLLGIGGAATPTAQGGLGALLSAGTSAATSVAKGAKENAQVVAGVAAKVGVDPVVAVAMMLVESGGRNTAVGDGGTSFGLFQLHEGGMLTAAGLTKEQAFDPETNASVALKSLAHEWAKGPNRSPGDIAAASQRPADKIGYAQKVNGALGQARALLA